VTTPEPSRDPSDAPSVAGAVAKFVAAGLVAVALFAVGALLVLRELGQREALQDARELAELAGRGIVEPALDDGLLAGDAVALARLDRLVQERVLGDRVVRVKVWTRDGRIVYSDEPRLIGSVYARGEDEQEALLTGETHAELSDLTQPENRFERGQGDLYEVYTRLRTASGTPLLFETYQRSAALVSTGRDIWLPFAAALLASLLLLWLVQVPLAWRLATRLRRSQVEREQLLERAVEASAGERRRIAAELHDGVVQDLAGLSYTLEAAADRASPAAQAETATTVRETASGLREAIRRLRSLLVEIHPPNLRAAGLAAALGDLLAPLRARGLETTLDVAEPPRDAAVEQLLFRAAGEAVRNVERHAGAHTVEVSVRRRDGNARVEVVDDGAGFDTGHLERRRQEGHVGLSLLEELAASRGGTLVLRSEPGRGTSFVFEVPDP
jgi:signal transduction histidine kinase